MRIVINKSEGQESCLKAHMDHHLGRFSSRISTSLRITKCDVLDPDNNRGRHIPLKLIRGMRDSQPHPLNVAKKRSRDHRKIGQEDVFLKSKLLNEDIIEPKDLFLAIHIARFFTFVSSASDMCRACVQRLFCWAVT